MNFQKEDIIRNRRLETKVSRSTLGGRRIVFSMMNDAIDEYDVYNRRLLF